MVYDSEVKENDHLMDASMYAIMADSIGSRDPKVRHA